MIVFLTLHYKGNNSPLKKCYSDKNFGRVTWEIMKDVTAIIYAFLKYGDKAISNQVGVNFVESFPSKIVYYVKALMKMCKGLIYGIHTRKNCKNLVGLLNTTRYTKPSCYSMESISKMQMGKRACMNRLKP